VNRRVDFLSWVRRIGPVWFAVVIVYFIFGIVSPGMFKLTQIMNILQVAAFLGTVTIGQTLALLAGGIDLSVSGVVTLVNIVLAAVMNGKPEHMVEAVAICLLLSILIGLINGVLVSVVRVTPLIVTLAMNSALFGAALVYTGGAPRGSVTAGFAVIGQGYVLGIPISAVCWLALAVGMAWVMRRTIYGGRLRAVGANPRAARAMGVKVERTLILAYVLSSVMAGFAGMLLTAYINLPSLGIGTQYQLTSVAAAVVGGTSLTGGIGSIIGAVGGVLFITELNSFTNMVKVSSGVQFVLQGVIIAASLVLYRVIGSASVRRPVVSCEPTIEGGQT
jgi:ribose transport system permease protein